MILTRLLRLKIWVVGPLLKKNATGPTRAVNVVHHLGLDVAYTRVPQQTRLKPFDSEDNHVVLSQLAATIYPVRPLVLPGSLPSFAPSPLGHILAPDVHLACFDILYYATSGVEVYEWRFSWSPVWQSIGRHLKFTQPMLRLGNEYLRRAFQVDESQDNLPPAFTSAGEISHIFVLRIVIRVVFHRFPHIRDMWTIS